MFILNTKSLFKLKVDKEYYSLLNDLIKFPLILFVMNILLYFTEKNRKKIFQDNFLKYLCF